MDAEMRVRCPALQKLQVLRAVVFYVFLLVAALRSTQSFQPTCHKLAVFNRIHWLRLNLFGGADPLAGSAANGNRFGGMSGAMKSMLKAQRIAKNTEDLKEQLEVAIIKGQDPAGEVIAEFSGIGTPLMLKISDTALLQGADAVSWAATQAMIDGYSKSRSAMIVKTESLCAELDASLSSPTEI